MCWEMLLGHKVALSDLQHGVHFKGLPLTDPVATGSRPAQSTCDSSAELEWAGAVMQYSQWGSSWPEVTSRATTLGKYSSFVSPCKHLLRFWPYDPNCKLNISLIGKQIIHLDRKTDNAFRFILLQALGDCGYDIYRESRQNPMSSKYRLAKPWW